MPLNTEFPAWLQQQYAPSQQSPWILQAIGLATQRYQMQQTLPLQIQRAQLQNQQIAVDTQHEGLANEALSRQLQQEQADLPVYNEWFSKYQDNPVGMIDAPMPNVLTPRYQKAALDAKHAAAQTSYVQSYQLQKINRMKQAAELNLAGADTASAIIEGPNGPNDIDFDPTRLSVLQAQVNATKQANLEELARVKQEHYYDEFGNPISGAGRGSALSVNDALLTDYQNKLKVAQDAGNTVEAQRIQGHIDYIMSQHRNPLLESRLGSLKSEKAKVAELMLYSKPGSDKYNQYKARYDELNAEMGRVEQEARGTAPTNAPTANPAASSKFSVGKVYVDKNGNRAIYQADGTWKQVP